MEYRELLAKLQSNGMTLREAEREATQRLCSEDADGRKAEQILKRGGLSPKDFLLKQVGEHVESIISHDGYQNARGAKIVVEALNLLIGYCRQHPNQPDDQYQPLKSLQQKNPLMVDSALDQFVGDRRFKGDEEVQIAESFVSHIRSVLKEEPSNTAHAAATASNTAEDTESTSVPSLR